MTKLIMQDTWGKRVAVEVDDHEVTIWVGPEEWCDFDLTERAGRLAVREMIVTLKNALDLYYITERGTDDQG